MTAAPQVRRRTLADLFTADVETLRCRWCFVPFDVTRDDFRAVIHLPRCPVGVLLIQWQHHDDPHVLDRVDALLDTLDAVDRRPPA